jgi:hypothetical protein
VANTKRTITRDSVFRGTGGTADRPAQGIAVNERPTRQTAVWLADDEVEWLDAQCQAVRRAGWRTVTRSAMIRSLIRAAMEQAPDLGGVSGERELAQRLLTK